MKTVVRLMLLGVVTIALAGHTRTARPEVVPDPVTSSQESNGMLYHLPWVYNPVGSDTWFEVFDIAGHVNGDGFADIICSNDDDEVRGFHGGTRPLGEIVEDWQVIGDPGSDFGRALAAAGDVNADGYDDVIVGAPAAGEAFVYLGSAGGLATEPVWSHAGIAGFVGEAVSGAGDVDNDGYDDVIVSDRASDNVLVFRGASDGVHPIPWVLTHVVPEGFDVREAAPAGDVNGDGYDDIILGNELFNPGGLSKAGRAYVFLGGASGPSLHEIIDGTAEELYLGRSVDGAGDVNGDGYDDVIIGAPSATYSAGDFCSDRGRVFVHYGSSAGISATPDWTVQGHSPGEYLGWSVSTAGDVNQDGYDDVVMGLTGQHACGPTWSCCCCEPCDNPDANCSSASRHRAFLYLGSADGLSECPPWMYKGPDAVEVLAGGGDFDGDGYDDWLLGGSGRRSGRVGFGEPSLVNPEDTDQDGFCGVLDCEEDNPYCGEDCDDNDSDGYCADFDCNDDTPYCTVDCIDFDSDGFCAEYDCDEFNPGCALDCEDDDGDGYCDLDCDDANPNCSVSCADPDDDGYCWGHDCDDFRPFCREDCTNLDHDNHCKDFDCNDLDNSIWQVPSAITGLFLGPPDDRVVWVPPASSGGVPGTPMSYDTLRSPDATDFVNGMVCLEVDDGTDQQTWDYETPPSGNLFHYIVRPRNVCGDGPMGPDSQGDPRPAGPCAP